MSRPICKCKFIGSDFVGSIDGDHAPQHFSTTRQFVEIVCSVHEFAYRRRKLWSYEQVKNEKEREVVKSIYLYDFESASRDSVAYQFFCLLSKVRLEVFSCAPSLSAPSCYFHPSPSLVLTVFLSLSIATTSVVDPPIVSNSNLHWSTRYSFSVADTLSRHPNLSLALTNDQEY